MTHDRPERVFSHPYVEGWHDGYMEARRKERQVLETIHVKTPAELRAAIKAGDKQIIIERTWSLMWANILFGLYHWAQQHLPKPPNQA